MTYPYRAAKELRRAVTVSRCDQVWLFDSVMLCVAVYRKMDDSQTSSKNKKKKTPQENKKQKHTMKYNISSTYGLWCV